MIGLIVLKEEVVETKDVWVFGRFATVEDRLLMYYIYFNKRLYTIPCYVIYKKWDIIQDQLMLGLETAIHYIPGKRFYFVTNDVDKMEARIQNFFKTTLENTPPKHEAHIDHAHQYWDKVTYTFIDLIFYYILTFYYKLKRN